ncbi:MAG: MBL fold metallo-hydrolase, partial [Myxococcota bacterium]
YRVLLTHTHLDHVLGLPDVPPGTVVIAGAGELRERGVQAALLRGTYRRLFDGITLSALDPAQAVPLGELVGWDLVGDGSVWALAAPGHTPGSTAYLARTPDGPVLAVGDTSHTRWGWDHGVTPGTYTEDLEGNARSLGALRSFAARHPTMKVLVGHE